MWESGGGGRAGSWTREQQGLLGTLVLAGLAGLLSSAPSRCEGSTQRFTFLVVTHRKAPLRQVPLFSLSYR